MSHSPTHITDHRDDGKNYRRMDNSLLREPPAEPRNRLAGRGLAVLLNSMVLASLVIMLAPMAKAQSRASSSALKPELQPLSFFIGHWSCAGEFPASHKPISSRIVFSPKLDGSWLVMRWDDNPPNQFHALELWGFDKAEHHFTNSTYNNSGDVYAYPSPGWIGDKLTWARDLPPNSPAISERYVFDRKSTKEFAYSWEVRKSQGWVIGDRLSCRRDYAHDLLR